MKHMETPNLDTSELDKAGLVPQEKPKPTLEGQAALDGRYEAPKAHEPSPIDAERVKEILGKMKDKVEIPVETVQSPETPKSGAVREE